MALLSGTVVGTVTWAVLTRPYANDTSAYYLENSVPGGGGTNVVNVILVDFRGFDTLGEIAVLAIAALGIFALLQDLRLPPPATDTRGAAWSSERHPLIMQLIARLLLPITLLVAVYLFLRGHNLPGGGFIAALVAALALVMQYLASGIEWTQARFAPDYTRVMAAGLLVATGTGLASWLLGYPFLTSTFTHLHWPVVGEFEIASAMAFDLGVLLTVVGVVMLVLIQLGRLGDESRRAPATREDIG